MSDTKSKTGFTKRDQLDDHIEHHIHALRVALADRLWLFPDPTGKYQNLEDAIMCYQWEATDRSQHRNRGKGSA